MRNSRDRTQAECRAPGLIRLHRREAIQIDRAPLRRIVRSSDVAETIDWLLRRRCMVHVAQQHLCPAAGIDTIQQNNSTKVP
jgi:hypothetical protein